jgi:hypothetical protein
MCCNFTFNKNIAVTHAAGFRSIRQYKSYQAVGGATVATASQGLVAAVLLCNVGKCETVTLEC